MSRYDLVLQPQGIIPRDAELRLQMRPATSADAADAASVPKLAIESACVQLDIGATQTLTVSASSVPTSDLAVSLALADGTVASLSSAAVVIPAGDASATVVATGVAAGATALTASAAGYSDGLGCLTVGGSGAPCTPEFRGWVWVFTTSTGVINTDVTKLGRGTTVFGGSAGDDRLYLGDFTLAVEAVGDFCDAVPTIVTSGAIHTFTRFADDGYGVQFSATTNHTTPLTDGDELTVQLQLDGVDFGDPQTFTAQTGGGCTAFISTPTVGGWSAS